MRVRLADLHPKLDGGSLVFDCPNRNCAHRTRIPLAPHVDRAGQSWKHTGEFPDTLTVSPSVNAGCWHGYIIDGEITSL